MIDKIYLYAIKDQSTFWSKNILQSNTWQMTQGNVTALQGKILLNQQSTKPLPIKQTQ